MDGEITFRRVQQDDFGLLARWLAQPHVERWWVHETSPEAVERDFGPASRGEEPSEDLLALLDGRPVGLVQRCRLADYPEYLAEIEPVTAVPEGAVSIDYFVGDPADTGRGVGTLMIRAITELTWADHPSASAVLVPVSAANRASWRALERAGFTWVATGEMEPDNPVDDRLHHVYRLDRSDLTDRPGGA